VIWVEKSRINTEFLFISVTPLSSAEATRAAITAKARKNRTIPAITVPSTDAKRVVKNVFIVVLFIIHIGAKA
jgi:hypothetical protein